MSAEQKLRDPTFRSYNSEQAKSYSESRLSYPQPLYDTVLRHHAETGGRFDLLLDVGCGPGTATRDLSRSFGHAIGLDAGDEMIQAARRLGGKTSSGEPVGFHVSPAETIAETSAVSPGSVDLLTVATAVSFPGINSVVNSKAIHLWSCESLNDCCFSRCIGSRCPSSGRRQPSWSSREVPWRCGPWHRSTVVRPFSLPNGHIHIHNKKGNILV